MRVSLRTVPLGGWELMGVLIVKIHAKIAKLYKRGWPSKSLGEKSCEIKGGGHEISEMI